MEHNHVHDDDVENDADEDHRHFVDVVASFKKYKDHSMTHLQRLSHNFGSLSAAHKKILKDYPGKLSAIKHSIDANTVFLNELIGDVDLFEQKGTSAAEAEAVMPSADQMDKVHSTLRQFVRDWADEGRMERQKCYDPILEEVERRLPLKGEVNKYRVLVPGCGLARLLWEFAHRGYAAQGNEFSYHMLLAANWVLNRTGSKNCSVIYPYALSGCNRVQLADQFKGISVPNIVTSDLPKGVDLSMNAGEFCIVYGSEDFKEYFNVVAAPFFLDTAHNAVEYMETIWHTLKPGGFWINLGPLLWHYSEQFDECQIELTMTEVIHAAEQVGFQVEMKSPIACSYASDRMAMMQTVYNCCFFVCTKPIDT